MREGMMWKGKPIDECDRFELLEAVFRLEAYRFADQAIRRRFMVALRGQL